MIMNLQRSAANDTIEDAFKAKAIEEALALRLEPEPKPAEKHVDFAVLREEAIRRFSKTLAYLAK